MRKAVTVSFAIICILIFTGTVWFAYNKGAESGDSKSVPLISADTEPFRIKPTDPGGMDVPFRDMLVYEDLLGDGGELPASGTTADGTQVVQLDGDGNVIEGVQAAPTTTPDAITSGVDGMTLPDADVPPPSLQSMQEGLSELPDMVKQLPNQMPNQLPDAASTKTTTPAVNNVANSTAPPSEFGLKDPLSMPLKDSLQSTVITPAPATDAMTNTIDTATTVVADTAVDLTNNNIVPSVPTVSSPIISDSSITKPAVTDVLTNPKTETAIETPSKKDLADVEPEPEPTPAPVAEIELKQTPDPAPKSEPAIPTFPLQESRDRLVAQAQVAAEQTASSSPYGQSPASKSGVSRIPLENTPTTSPVKAPSLPVASPTAALPPASTTTGTYRIQLGAVKSDADARAEWSRLQGKFPEFLSGLSLTVEPVTIPDKGTFYRVQGGSINKANADTRCQGITVGGGSCIVVKR